MKILTLTFESLPEQPIEHSATMITERWWHVIVDLELVRHIDIEALCQHLQTEGNNLMTAVP